jgi:predicted signal transduction protein with EAL and GGDEF domain
MKTNRNFLTRTFGQNGLFKFIVFITTSIIIAIIPSYLNRSALELNIPKFCEEWFRNIVSLSAIFIIANYLNYYITQNRNKDKIKMLINNFIVLGDGIINNISSNNFVRSENINLTQSLELILKKIQNEDEYLYNVKSIEDFNNYSYFFNKLTHKINEGKISDSELDSLKIDLTKIKSDLIKFQ